MRAASAKHWTYFDHERRLVVEWYDHGPGVPYESANLLIFADADLDELALQIGADHDIRGKELLDVIANKFDSWFAFKAFVTNRHIRHSEETDFCP